MSPKKADTTERITGAAKELFIRQGFRGTSTKQIAQEAAVSEMTLFRHFRTKEAIFRAVILPLVSFFDELQIKKNENLKDLARQMIENRLSFLCEENGLVRLVLMESYLSPLGFNPIVETTDRIRGMIASIDKSKGELFLRLIMGFILTCLFLPEDCETFPEHLNQLVSLLE